MYVSFPYPGIEGVNIPDQNIMGIYQPKCITDQTDAVELIQQALSNPIQSPPLHELVEEHDSVLILVDDNTRMTPASTIIPCVLAELHAAGVRDENITFLIALGTHRPMQKAELIKKLGKDILNRYKVLQHQWDREETVKYIGKTENGTEIYINKHVLDASFVMGIGQIFPHRIAGFSGGAKIIQPGVCGEITTGQTHWLGAKYSGEEIEGVVDNPVRRELNEIAHTVGLRFIINVIMDADERIIEVVAGDPVAAHRKGAEISLEVHGEELPSQADVVIIEAYPADIDLWQVGKAIYAAGICVKKGGVVIVVSPCYEGVSPTHGKLLLKYGCHQYKNIKKLVDEGKIKDLTAAAVMAYMGEVIERSDLILVTQGITEIQAKALNMKWARTVQDALNYAKIKLGYDFKVAVIKKGGNFLPVIKSTK